MLFGTNLRSKNTLHCTLTMVACLEAGMLKKLLYRIIALQSQDMTPYMEEKANGIRKVLNYIKLN